MHSCTPALRVAIMHRQRHQKKPENATKHMSSTLTNTQPNLCQLWACSLYRKRDKTPIKLSLDDVDAAEISLIWSEFDYFVFEFCGQKSISGAKKRFFWFCFSIFGPQWEPPAGRRVWPRVIVPQNKVPPTVSLLPPPPPVSLLPHRRLKF